MSKKRKLSEIQFEIREMMRNRVIDRGMKKQKQGFFDQNEQYFVYLVVKNTNPAMCHLFDLEEPVMIGRAEKENQICIQDVRVSRRQCCIWKRNGAIYLSDLDATNPTCLKRGFHRVFVSAGQTLQLYSKDVIMIEDIRLQVWFFRGENEISG